MYVQPGNPYDLTGCWQKQGEFLWDYIWHFFPKVPRTPQHMRRRCYIGSLVCTTCRTLLHELGHEQPNTTKELLNIATRHASSEEAVRAVFVQGRGKVVLSGGWGTSVATSDKGTKRGIKSDKRGAARLPQRVAVTTSCDEEMNGKDANDSDEELMMVVEGDFKCLVWSPTNHFEKLLQVTCPLHTFPVKHKMKECSMMKSYMATGSLAKVKKPQGSSARKASTTFLVEMVVMSIHGGLAPMSHAETLYSSAGRSTP
jgi:hypothetical protein